MRTTIQVTSIIAAGCGLLYLTKAGVGPTLRVLARAIWAFSFALEAFCAGVRQAGREACAEYARQYRTDLGVSA